MDHIYIDAQRIPERYVAGGLAPEMREAFEAHLVDCPECADRLLLAEMFHTRNGHPAKSGATADATPPPETENLASPPQLPVHAWFAAQFSPWAYALILGVAAALLLGVSTIIYLWELGRW